jgi:hypothetical protein
MNESEKPVQSGEAEDERVLRDNLHVQALSPEALDRIRRATEVEWRAKVVRRAGADADCRCSRCGIVRRHCDWTLWSGGQGEMPANRWRAWSATPGVGAAPVVAQSAVNVGAECMPHNGSACAATPAQPGWRRQLLAQFGVQVMSPDAIRLVRGEMYVDTAGLAHRAEFRRDHQRRRVPSPRHAVAISVADGATRLRVREGSVQWQSPQGESTVKGTEVLIDRDQNVAAEHRRRVSWHGSVLAPDVDIEDRPLKSQLRARNRSQPLADQATRHQVATIRMHGVHGLPPLEALKVVMASTSLRLDLSAGVIRVSFAGGSTARN